VKVRTLTQWAVATQSTGWAVATQSTGHDGEPSGRGSRATDGRRGVSMTERFDTPTDDRRRDGEADVGQQSNRRGFLKTGVRAVASTTAASALLAETVGVPNVETSIPDVRVPFHTDEYAEPFTSARITDDNRIVEGPGGASRSLRVTVPEGDHYGTAMDYRFLESSASEPERLHSRYSLYVPPGLDVGGSGKLPGPVGTYDTAGWGGRPADGTNGWSARMGFADPDDADGDVLLTSYVYHAEMDGQFGTHFEWDRDGNGLLESGRWYRIDNYVRLNTPGERDGVVRGWVDGDLAVDVTDLRFRDVDRLRIQEFWFRVYYGGDDPAPAEVTFNFGTLELRTRKPTELPLPR